MHTHLMGGGDTLCLSGTEEGLDAACAQDSPVGMRGESFRLLKWHVSFHCSHLSCH